MFCVQKYFTLNGEGRKKKKKIDEKDENKNKWKNDTRYKIKGFCVMIDVYPKDKVWS